MFEIPRTIYSNSRNSEQFLLTEWFFKEKKKKSILVDFSVITYLAYFMRNPSQGVSGRFLDYFCTNNKYGTFMQDLGKITGWLFDLILSLTLYLFKVFRSSQACFESVWNTNKSCFVHLWKFSNRRRWVHYWTYGFQKWKLWFEFLEKTFIST